MVVAFRRGAAAAAQAIVELSRRQFVPLLHYGGAEGKGDARALSGLYRAGNCARDLSLALSYLPAVGVAEPTAAEYPLVAPRVISRRLNNSVAFGAERTLTAS